MKKTVFSDVAPYSVVHISLLTFGRPYYVQFQDRIVSQARNKHRNFFMYPPSVKRNVVVFICQNTRAILMRSS